MENPCERRNTNFTCGFGEAYSRRTMPCVAEEMTGGQSISRKSLCASGRLGRGKRRNIRLLRYRPTILGRRHIHPKV